MPREWRYRDRYPFRRVVLRILVTVALAVASVLLLASWLVERFPYQK